MANPYNSPEWVQDFIARDLGVIGEEGEIVGGAPGPSPGSILCGLDFVDAGQPWIAVFTTADTQFDGSNNAPGAQPTSGAPQIPHANVTIGADGVLTPITGSSTATGSTAAAPPAAGTTQGFGGCPSGEDRNDTGYCIPVSEPGPTCAVGESRTACGPYGRGPTPPGAGQSSGGTTITSTPATRAEVEQLTAAALAASDTQGCGFNPSAYYLGGVRITNNGWALANIDARNPADQGNEAAAFHLVDGEWRCVEAGSSFRSVPQAVLHAF